MRKQEREAPQESAAHPENETHFVADGTIKGILVKHRSVKFFQSKRDFTFFFYKAARI